MKVIEQLLDFCYVVIQRRLSSARLMMTAGSQLFIVTGLGSLAFKFQNGDFSLTVDTASDSRGEIALMFGAYIGLFIMIVGFIFEVKAHLFGDAASKNRAKSIDLRSLDGASAPTLCSVYNATIEPSGLHKDLFLEKPRAQSIEGWLSLTCDKFANFYKDNLQRLNSHESSKPLALGAIAHTPHCFVLGFLVGNKRLVNYYCWNRDGGENAKWVDCRNKRTRGQVLQTSDIASGSCVVDDHVRKIGLSIEVSFSNDLNNFLEVLNLDRAISYSVEKKSVGGMFSDKEQSKFVESLRHEINSNLLEKYPNLQEIHITIMAQASLIMRIAAEFNQNHIKKDLYIYHFEKGTYPWALTINKNKDIGYRLIEDFM